MPPTEGLMTDENGTGSNILRHREGTNTRTETSDDGGGGGENRRFEAFAWCVEQNDDEGDHGGDIELDEIEGIRNALADYYSSSQRADELVDSQMRDVSECLDLRREALRQIRDDRGHHNEDEDVSEEPLLDLSGYLVFRLSFFLPRVKQLLRCCQAAFALDLIALLRRHRNNIFRIKIGGCFIRKIPMADMLLKCIGNLPLLQTLHLRSEKRGRLSYQLARPLLLSAPHSLRGLHLESLCVENHDEMKAFASCFAASPTTPLGQHGRWESLTSLVIRKISAGSVETNVDPIFRAIGGEGGEGNGGHHLPNLETFRLIQDIPLKEDGALTRLLRKPSIKHLTLTNFLRHRHFILMERHLSVHPSIETLKLCVRDFYDFDATRGLNPKKKQQACAAMQSLIRLAVANPNVMNVHIGRPSQDWLEPVLRPALLELVVWITLNRVGLGRFVGGSSSPTSQLPASCPPLCSPLDCAELLLALCTLDRGKGDDIPWIEPFVDEIGEEFKAAAALEALYVSIRAMPELLCPSRDEGAPTATSDET